MRLASAAISLFRRTGHRPVRTEHATLTGFRLKCLPASTAYIEKLTGVFWHLFGGLMPTVRASDCGDFDHVSTASDPPCGSCCTNPERRQLFARTGARRCIQKQTFAVQTCARYWARRRLLNHLICAKKNGLRVCDIERLCRSRIYDQFELRRALRGVRTFQDTIDIVCKPTIGFREARSISAKCTTLRENGPSGDHGYTAVIRKLDNFLTILNSKSICEDRNRLHWRCRNFRKGVVE